MAAAGNIAPAPSGPEYVVIWGQMYYATYPWPVDSIEFNSSTGWGALQTLPSTNSATAIQGMAKSHNDSRVWFTNGTNPYQYMYEWDWTNGFGALTSKPTNSGGARNIYLSDDGSFSFSTTTTSPYLYGFETSENGWGAAWGSSGTTLTPTVLAVNEALSFVVVGSSTTPYVYSCKYNRTAKTFGTKNNFTGGVAPYTSGQSIDIAPNGTMCAVGRNSAVTGAVILYGINPSTSVPTGTSATITYSSTQNGQLVKFISDTLLFTGTRSAVSPYNLFEVSNSGATSYTPSIGTQISQPTNNSALVNNAKLNPAGDIMFIGDYSSAAQATGNGYEKFQAWTWTNANGLGTKYSAPDFTSRYGNPWSGYPSSIKGFVVMGPNPNL